MFRTTVLCITGALAAVGCTSETQPWAASEVVTDSIEADRPTTME